MDEPKSEAELIQPDPDYMAHEPNTMRAIEYFGIAKEDITDNQDKLQAIMKWAKTETGSDDIVDWLLKVKDLEHEIGVGLSSKRLENVHLYVQLDSDEKRIRKEKELLRKKFETAPKPFTGRGSQSTGGDF